MFCLSTFINVVIHRFTDTWNGRGKPSRHWTTPGLLEAQNQSDEPNTCVYINGPLASMYLMEEDCGGIVLVPTALLI